MRVLIVRLDHLGDVLLTTPLVRAALRGGHEVHVLVRENSASVFQGHRFVFRSQITGNASEALRTAGVAAPPALRKIS